MVWSWLWCSLYSHLKPLLKEIGLLWHRTCVSGPEKCLEPFFAPSTCWQCYWENSQASLTLTFQPRAFQSRTLQFTQLTLAESPNSKFLLQNWSNLGSSQQSERVWEAFPHSPSHGPVFSVPWNRKGGGFSSLPSISGGCPSLFVTGDFQEPRSLEIRFLKIISTYIYLLLVSKDQHCFIFIM